MVQINWTLQAKNDLKDIAEYISKDSIVYAKRQVFKIRLKTDILKYLDNYFTSEFSNGVILNYKSNYIIYWVIIL